jgi:hypothetical protein
MQKEHVLERREQWAETEDGRRQHEVRLYLSAVLRVPRDGLQWKYVL